MVGLISRYRNRDTQYRLECLIAGEGRDRPSDRTVRSQRRCQQLSVEQVRELVKAREQGAEINELAEQFGVDRSTVLEHLKREGVPGRRWPGRTLDPERLEEAGRLYQSGVSAIRVAEQFGVDRRYLRDALREAGVAIRAPGRRRQ